MQKTLDKLKKHLGEVNDIRKSIGLLGWDQETCMPPGGANARASQISTLTRIAHDMFISDEVGEMLENLKQYGDDLPYDSDDASLLRYADKRYKKNKKVPSEHAAAMAKLASSSQVIWAKARQDDDFKAFQPCLDNLLELTREYADFFAPYNEIYDVLLDDYEPGLKTCEVRTLFDELEKEQVALIKRVVASQQVDDSILHGEFQEKAQWDFSILAATKIGYDWNCGRIDKSAHPFSQAMDMGDARITTRVDNNFLGSNFSSVLHETGHAMYEQGIAKNLSGSIVAEGASYAIHESQSRFWENIVGRSKEFWTHMLPDFKKAFPEKAASADVNTLFKAFNKVEPSLIRVEADEISYNLHIMLRMDLEILLLENKMKTADLPDAWREGMKKRFGITPPNDADGVLQDVHWSIGAFGYFPTYAIGNVISAQLWQAMQKDIDASKMIAKGDFSEVLAWLREKIHRYGSKFEPNELIEKATGQKLSHKPYIDYLTAKLTKVYGW
jgi:carboxypeptidase Taq